MGPRYPNPKTFIDQGYADAWFPYYQGEQDEQQMWQIAKHFVHIHREAIPSGPEVQVPPY